MVITDSEGRVQGVSGAVGSAKKALADNPNVVQTGVDGINAGIYIMEPEALDAIPTGRPVSVEREIYPKFLAEGQPIYAIARDGLLA